ncbi:MAG TPA: PIG-L deacetylase family protein [Ktedonobacteraceae bacterium]
MKYLQQLEQLNTIDDLRALPLEHILVIVAHPADIELWCGGTVCRLTDAGKQVAYLLFDKPIKGAGNATRTPQEIAAMQEAEEFAAARVLGVESVTFLHWPDSEVDPGVALHQELVLQIRHHRPDLIITHDPAISYRPHPDHRVLGSAMLDALFPSTQGPFSRAGQNQQNQQERLPFQTVQEAWLFTIKSPNIWINITTTLERKITARLAHTSQHIDAEALQRYWRDRSVAIGKQAGLEAAEAFKQVDLR